MWVKMRDIDIECKVPIEEFIEWVEDGSVIDYDGFGFLCDGENVLQEYIELDPDWLREQDVPFICWYNK